MNPTLKALLFDLDGTLADTDRLHEQAWLEALAAQGVRADHHFYQAQISGGVNGEIVSRILPHLSKAEGLAFIEGKEARFREIAGGIAPMPGLDTLLNWAGAKRLKLALVSNAPRVNALHLTEMLGLKFDLIVLSEELSAGKPDPLPYLTALTGLSLTPAEAVAFEDSPSGVRAAAGAGLYTVALTTGHPPQSLEAAGANLLVRDFADVKLWEVLNSGGLGRRV